MVNVIQVLQINRRYIYIHILQSAVENVCILYSVLVVKLLVAIIGLNVAKSEIREGETLEVVVELKHGMLDKNITVHFSTESGTAKGQWFDEYF